MGFAWLIVLLECCEHLLFLGWVTATVYLDCLIFGGFGFGCCVVLGCFLWLVGWLFDFTTSCTWAFVFSGLA